MAKGNSTPKGKSSTAPVSEIGRSGLLISGGVVLDEFLPQLRSAQGRRALREMSDNDPVVGGFLFAFEKTLARLNWHIEEPEDASADDTEIADFVQEAFEDMGDWEATLSSILSMMVYGWSFHEIVYKLRQGRNTKDPSRDSRYNDGKIGWRKWAVRSQESLMRWEVNPDSGDLEAMTQMVWGKGVFTIPMQKALLFRTTMNRDNPEGRPLIRNAYRAYYFKKRIEEIEAIGVERDLAGLPVVTMPPEFFSPSAAPDQKMLFDQMQKIVSTIKRNEAEGVVFPHAVDEHGNKVFTLELLSTGGSRQFDTDKIVTRYNQQMAMSVLADFLMLGHENVGTQSLGGSKIELWQMAVEALAKAIASVVNQYAVPRLLELNGMDAENPPKLVFGDVANTDLAALGTFLKQMMDAGAIVPDQKLEEYLRDIAHLTPIDEETREDVGSGFELTPEQAAALGLAKPPGDPLVTTAQAAAQTAAAPPAAGGPAKPAVKPGTNTTVNATQGLPPKPKVPPKPARQPSAAR